MDIKILDSWLREFLDTDAKPSEIAKYLSLCGPSVERVSRSGNDFVYDIEITTNRIDEAGVYGIAREASVILPRFGFKAKLLNPVKTWSLRKDHVFMKNVGYIDAKVDPALCPRFGAILIKNVKVGPSPEFITKRLESVGIRSINNIVDVTNYVMLELGQPVHAFDYDKIAKSQMTLRESRRGEEIQTLDGKKFVLPGGDIVIEDGEGKLIDLAGVMGGYLSMVDENTKNVLLFVQTYNPAKIRKTSMALAVRTAAATIFEKGTDTELVAPAILRTVYLIKKFAKGIPQKEILDIYRSPFKPRTITVPYQYICRRLGLEIPKEDVSRYLSGLGFDCKWSKDIVNAKIPSFRSKDVTGPEDILEEIARIFGYHNLQGKLMNGEIPAIPEDPKFYYEKKIKDIISGFGGTEVYTLSLVPEKDTDGRGLKLINPLGPDTKFLRTSLMPSMLKVAEENIGIYDKYHLYEIANIYIANRGSLPEEKRVLAGIFVGYDYRSAKGVVEAILKRLNLTVSFTPVESKGFDAGKCASVYCKNSIIGKVGILENFSFFYYEFNFSQLLAFSFKTPSFTPIPKYPGQIEDLTFSFPSGIKVGEVISTVYSADKSIKCVDLKDIYKDSYTFRVTYRDTQKTLTDIDVDKIRKEIILLLKQKFTANFKG